jgi:hypothetical protein
MEYIDGIEYNDRFISDKALDVLDTLAYLQLVGLYDVRNRIIFEYDDSDIKDWTVVEGGESYIDCDSHRKFRVDTDDVTKEIVHLLLKIDKNIFDIVIGEFNIDEEKKYYGFKYPIYAKCYYWDERIGIDKKRDENFIQISCESVVWKEFVKISRHRGLTLEDLFKIAIIRFLEKRYDICLKELQSDKSGAERVWFME